MKTLIVTDEEYDLIWYALNLASSDIGMVELGITDAEREVVDQLAARLEQNKAGN